MWSDVPPEEFARLQGPWFASVRPWLVPLLALSAFPTVAQLDEILRARLALVDVRLVAQPPKKTRAVSAADLYEVRAANGCVLTREHNWHDLFNALSWAAFPLAKHQLTARLAAFQRARWRPSGLPGTRAVAHDRLALLDEGAVLLYESSSAGTKAWVFGHALLEHAVQGHTDVRAAVAIVTATTMADADAELASRLSASEAVESGPGLTLAADWFA